MISNQCKRAFSDETPYAVSRSGNEKDLASRVHSVPSPHLLNSRATKAARHPRSYRSQDRVNMKAIVVGETGSLFFAM